jgi:hypothetical protein
LQKFFRIVQQFIRLLGVHPQGARRQLRCNGCSCDRRIRRNEANLIDVYMWIALQRCFQLLGQLQRFRAAACREAADKPRQACLGYFGRKMDTRDSRRRQHSSEAFFHCRRFQRRSVQQQLIAGNSEQQASVAIRAQRRTQFRPGSLVLFSRPRMAKVVHARELEQDVQAAHKCASGCGPSVGVGRHCF